MSQRTRGDRHGSAIESKFYLPVGVTPEAKDSLLERLRTTLFGHRL